MNHLGRLIILALGAVGLAYATTTNWETAAITGEEAHSSGEHLQPAGRESHLNLDIHSEEIFQEARVDLHDGK